MAALIVIAAVLAAAGFVLVRSRWWPYRRCPACQDRKGRGIGSTDRAYNRCRRCDGSGELIRPAALLWTRHREEARRRKS